LGIAPRAGRNGTGRLDEHAMFRLQMGKHRICFSIHDPRSRLCGAPSQKGIKKAPAYAGAMFKAMNIKVLLAPQMRFRGHLRLIRPSPER